MASLNVLCPLWLAKVSSNPYQSIRGFWYRASAKRETFTSPPGGSFSEGEAFNALERASGVD